MNRHGDNLRRGMSLIELLVVVAILGLLTVVVVPNIANTGDRRKVREAARQVSSFIAGAQARAIGSRGGAGIWIDPLENRIASDDGLEHIVALDFAIAEVPEPYAGETTDARVRIDPQVIGPHSFGMLSFEPAATFSLPTQLSDSLNMRIRFGGAAIPFLLSNQGGQWVAMHDSMSRNQTPENCPWPITEPDGVAYEVILPATRSAIQTLTLGDSVAVDLSWSVIGTPLASWPSPPGLPPPGGSAVAVGQALSPSQVLYNTAGGLSLSIRADQQSTPVTEPIYFLVASLKDIQEGTCFTKPGSFWVGVDPRGGIPRVAEVQLLTLLDPSLVRPMSQQQLVYTQQFIRKQPLVTGR